MAIGGDFMRGRLFMPVFTGASVFGGLALIHRQPALLALPLAAPASVLLALGGLVLSPSQTWQPDENGIGNVRLYYEGYSLISYFDDGELTDWVIDLRLVDSLAQYAESCGPTTIHFTNPGTLGYPSGSGVSFIDMLGLTDDFIADLPQSNQTNTHPRAGPARKWIPSRTLLNVGTSPWFTAGNRPLRISTAATRRTHRHSLIQPSACCLG